jgi:hypothetical protein
VTRTTEFALIAMLVALLAGCGAPDETEPVEAGDGADTEQQRLVPLPGDAGDLPPGHPPLETGDTGGGLSAPPPGSGTGAAGLAWTTPEGWIEETPSSTVRRAQYRVPGPGGDAEFVVFYFGPGQGGDPMSNAMRWAGQFTQPDGSSSLDRLETREEAVGALTVLRVEVSGSYSNVMVSDETIPDAMLLGAIAQGPDANWFFKLTGPRDTVEGQRAGFDGLIASLRPGQ